MRAAKKKKLQEQGFHVGDTSDFLGLSDAEDAYLELKVKLATGLRARRKKQAMTQDQVAALIHSSQSRVAKMEAGDPSVSIDLLLRSLLALGATDKELARLIAK